MDQLLQSEKLSDVAIVLKCGKKFAAHKNILISRSPVFAGMFEHETKEKLENRIEIEDITEEVCKEFLHFIYTDHISQDCEYFWELLVLADKVCYWSCRITR